ncbi:MAG TPA: hypothetical protein VKK31_00665 [Thermoanaerobaculia bacterium]|nr:hypothetical protein [Thermoanaerobaculia bacterium]
MKTSRWVYVSCVLLVLSLVSPSFLLAEKLCCSSNRLDGSLKNRLDRAATDLTSDGFEPMDTYLGMLSDGAANIVTLQLTRGKDYGFVAVCESCSGLDLVLYDEENQSIGSNVGTGNHAAVNVTPTRTGKYKLVLRMTKCRQDDSCYHKIGVFGRSHC